MIARGANVCVAANHNVTLLHVAVRAPEVVALLLG